MKILKPLMVISIAFFMPSFPAAGESSGRVQSVDPVLQKILSHPEVLKNMHTIVGRNGGVLDELFEQPVVTSDPQVYEARLYWFRYNLGTWQDGIAAGKTGSNGYLLGSFTVGVTWEKSSGKFVDVAVGEPSLRSPP